MALPTYEATQVRPVREKVEHDASEFLLFFGTPSIKDKRRLTIDYAGMIRDDMEFFINSKLHPYGQCLTCIRPPPMPDCSDLSATEVFHLVIDANRKIPMSLDHDGSAVILAFYIYKLMAGLLARMGYFSGSTSPDMSTPSTTDGESESVLDFGETLTARLQSLSEDSAHGECASKALAIECPWSEVIQELSPEDEVATTIQAGEAECIARGQWESQIERHISLVKAPENIGVKVPQSKTILVLPLTKHSQEVERALLESPIAQGLIEKGVDVKPEWAGGAKIFVEDFTYGDAAEFRVWFGSRLGLGPHHVVVTMEQEACVLKSLLKIRKNDQATVKKGGMGGGRAAIPNHDSLSWFQCSDPEDISSIADEVQWPEEAHAAIDNALLPRYHIIVRHTFIDGFSDLENDSESSAPSKACSDPF